jgi:YggT family protein
MTIMLIQIIHLASRILTLLIVADAILSFIMSPFHPVRVFMGKILTPLYTPIRRILPTAGGMDFSPLVLLVIVNILETILVSAITRIG